MKIWGVFLCKEWLFHQNRYFNFDLQNNYFIMSWLGDMMESSKIQENNISATGSVVFLGTAETALPAQI